MRIISIISVLLLLSACGSKETASYKLSDINVSGEFLFEGPNTLQGPITIGLEKIADEIGIKSDQIKAIYVNETIISFSPDSARAMVESALVQWVSDNLPLVSVATKSPIPDDKMISLEVNPEQDILKYLKDDSSTLVVDTNLSKDADNLEATVSFLFNIIY